MKFLLKKDIYEGHKGDLRYIQLSFCKLFQGIHGTFDVHGP